MDALDSAEYSGSLIILLNEGVGFVKRNMKIRWKKTANSRIEMPDYCERSVFEAALPAAWQMAREYRKEIFLMFPLHAAIPSLLTFLVAWDTWSVKAAFLIYSVTAFAKNKIARFV